MGCRPCRCSGPRDGQPGAAPAAGRGRVSAARADFPGVYLPCRGGRFLPERKPSRAHALPDAIAPRTCVPNWVSAAPPRGAGRCTQGSPAPRAAPAGAARGCPGQHPPPRGGQGAGGPRRAGAWAGSQGIPCRGLDFPAAMALMTAAESFSIKPAAVGRRETAHGPPRSAERRPGRLPGPPPGLGQRRGAAFPRPRPPGGPARRRLPLPRRRELVPRGGGAVPAGRATASRAAQTPPLPGTRPRRGPGSRRGPSSPDPRPQAGAAAPHGRAVPVPTVFGSAPRAPRRGRPRSRASSRRGGAAFSACLAPGLPPPLPAPHGLGAAAPRSRGRRTHPSRPRAAALHP